MPALLWLVVLAAPAANRFEPAIARFEQRDREAPPIRGGVHFLGSSTVAGWNLRTCFPGLRALNRGFGGSTVADSVHFFERVVVPYRPRLIVFYAGDNDIAAGTPPEQVVADFEALVAKLHTALPRCRLAFLGIKPSAARWAKRPLQQQANAAIAARCAADPRLRYIDTDPLTLGPDGRPRPELFKADRLHLNEAGYAIWSRAVRRQLADWLRPAGTAPRHRLGRRGSPHG